ncbi:hypothetical protein P3T36_000376 [Kitasatospora sp. MAP12-15]|uniref:hypothetical protein n=1 Tax=unclassified Kitasatospora TaxID=2633591 RepID=UPI002474E93B|nr:hypothetical protein [Kitasatospora sp. MAP12-44]MDH6109605.1 hypothetical protein [Kitasatospora sp. MAP12-44]
MDKSDIVREVLVEGLDDWVSVIALVRYSMESEPDNFEKLTSDILGELLGDGLVAVGDLGETGFERRPGNAEDNARRVLRELKEGSWNPPDGGCWLCNTDAGDARARLLLDAPASGS